MSRLGMLQRDELGGSKLCGNSAVVQVTKPLNRMYVIQE